METTSTSSSRNSSGKMSDEARAALVVVGEEAEGMREWFRDAESLSFKVFAQDKVVLTTEDEKAIVTLKFSSNLPEPSSIMDPKSPLRQTILEFVRSVSEQWTFIFQNDGYCHYSHSFSEMNDLLKLKCELKADPHSTLVNKTRQAKIYKLEESASVYADKVKPHLESTAPCKWVDNIIDGTKESERVLMRDDDFLVVEGSSYDSKTMPRSEGKFLVLFNDENLKSYRDLKPSHLDMLLRIQERIKIISFADGSNLHDFKAYFHYFPSFLRLHLHISHISCSFGVNFGRARGLSETISLLQLTGKNMDEHLVHLTSTIFNFPHKFLVKEVLEETAEEESKSRD